MTLPIAIILAFALQSTTTPPPPQEPASERLADSLEAVEAIDEVDCTDPSAKCPSQDSEYRLPLEVNDDRNLRQVDALKNDGSECALIGQTICETEPRPILNSNETIEETLGSSLDPD